MALGMEVGLGRRDIVLDKDPAPLPQKGGRAAPQFSAHFYCNQTAMHQDATCYGGRLQSRRLCVRCGPSSPPQKGAEPLPPIFGPRLLWPNGCMVQGAAWYGGRLRPTRHCVRWGPSSPPLKGHTPNFRPLYVVAKRLDGLRCHLVWR